MKVIRYNEQKRYKFALQVLELASALEGQTDCDSEKCEIHVENEFLAQLLERISDGYKAVVVPNLQSSRFLITASDRRQLELACQRVRHFLVPTYATFTQELKPLPFNGRHPLQLLGAELYPSGYYVLKSRKEFEHQVLYSLGLWMDLEERYPHAERRDEVLTYGRLYERFRMALAAAQWGEAEQARRTMLLLNLTTGENLLFLKIEQFALQRRWNEIWQCRDRAQLVQARVPRSVRGALLTAFHQTVLFPLEQQNQWQEALETFRESLPLLGSLLTGRLGLTEGPVVQVFAYQSALEGDRVALLALVDVNSGSEAQLCIQQLLSLLAPEVSSAPVNELAAVRTPLSLAREALDYGDFDAARRYSKEVEESDAKIILSMQIAYHTIDVSLAEEALVSYGKYSPAELQQLNQRFPFISHIHGTLLQFVAQAEGQMAEGAEQGPALIQDWLAWFDHIKHASSSNSELGKAITRLAEICDERFWTEPHIEQFTERLLEIVDDAQLIKKDLVRDALLKITQFFLSDQEFPRTDVPLYRSLYETLYLALLAVPKELQYTGWLLLRLAEAQLRSASESCEAVFGHLKEWCGVPIPRLEVWALDTCEMLLDYGLEPAALTTWYQLWISELVRVQPHHQITNVNGWIDLSRCVPGSDALLDALRERFRGHLTATDDPIKLLPEGYRIGIYSLLEPSAQRAKEQLLARNPKLEIRICTDKVLTEMAKSIALQADMVVMVITAMKHAMTYGVGPLIDSAKVVRPQSSGSTSLVRAVEEYAAKYYL
ncbi:hypothetical protein KSC_002410 [Ktedonobacter sp. SOSP1-52]|uniref:protein DpdD n=1 Tax=Ktedonobacter sp. SOSP1-52 TaxID=2778366 RepID=UPI001A272383|nr:protein DpdD [Ktedonobacter sp. SOSP1-52]GHO61349.1 hypothetical protein KSC_002410 [Ktedonobacter sp. SOSP1-52]